MKIKLFQLIHVIYMKIIDMKPHEKVFLSCLLTHISAIFGPSTWNDLNEQLKHSCASKSEQYLVLF